MSEVKVFVKHAFVHRQKFCHTHFVHCKENAQFNIIRALRAITSKTFSTRVPVWLLFAVTVTKIGKHSIIKISVPQGRFYFLLNFEE